MATRTRIQVDGLAELGRAMKALGNEVGTKIARRATGVAAGIVKKKAVANVIAYPSVESGSLRDSIIAKRTGRKDTNLTSEHIVTIRGRGKPYNKKGEKINRAPHAHLVEFGTVNMEAEPFLRPAFEEKKNEAVTVMADALRKGIAAAQKKIK